MIIVKFQYGRLFDPRQTRSVQFDNLEAALSFIADHSPRSIKSFLVRYCGSHCRSDIEQAIDNALYSLDQ